MITWKQVPLEMNENGEIRLAGKLLTISTRHPRGYASTPLSIHRAMAFTFLGSPPDDGNYWVVDHIDGNPRNNQLSNLRWVTQAENWKNHARAPCLTSEQVAQIRVLKPPPQPRIVDLVRKWGCSRSAINLIRSGINQANGYNYNGHNVLSREQVEFIRAWKRPKPTAVEVARLYNVSRTVIQNIWSNTRNSR